jgi:hypothetical protein
MATESAALRISFNVKLVMRQLYNQSCLRDVINVNRSARFPSSSSSLASRKSLYKLKACFIVAAKIAKRAK